MKAQIQPPAESPNSNIQPANSGVKEEAPGLGVPVLVLHEVTERPEAVEAGTVQERILTEACCLLDDPAECEYMTRAVNPYDDGRASQRIVAALLGEPVEPFAPSQTPA